MGQASVDSVIARNGTAVTILLNGQRVGRVQQFRESQNNNVQVLAELGRDFMVEMKKGITAYTFSISAFYCRSDVMEQLKGGAVFGLTVRDENNIDVEGTGPAEILESFPRCMITSLDRDYTIGQASIGQSASVVTIGKGKPAPSAG